MTGRDVIRTALTNTQELTSWYLADLSDADLLVRPTPNANHIAWQLGHLIQGELALGGKFIPGATYPELPAGFAAQHDKKTAAIDPPKGFGTKEEYLGYFNKIRQATMDNVARLSDADLDKPIPGEMAKFGATVGAMCMLLSNHTLMHAGQFTCVRRKLDKPVLF